MACVSLTKDEILKKEKEVGLVECVNWINTFAPEKTKLTSLRSSVQAIIKKHKQLQKSRSRDEGEQNLIDFGREIYVFPKPLSESRKRKSDPLATIPDVDSIKYKNLALEIAGELYSKTCEVKELEEEIKENKKKRPATAKLKELRNTLKQQKTYINVLQQRIQSKQAALKRLRSQITYSERKLQKKLLDIQNVTDQNESLKLENASLEEKIDHLNTVIINLKQNAKEEREENDYLRLLLSDNSYVKLYDERKRQYTEKTQECVYEILNHNVTSSNVSPVIKASLALAGLKPDRLPSTSTINNMNIQRLMLSQKQIADELSGKQNTCLLSDETSKFCRKYEGFHVADETGEVWVMGLRELVTKSGQDMLTTLQQVLRDIKDVSDESENDVSKKLLLHIVSTMSDRAGTQVKFNSLLEDYRREILKEDLGEAWNRMSTAEQLSVSTLCNFFCGLHVLVHIAEAASASLVQAESASFENDAPILDSSFKCSGESGCVRLIRTGSKAFSCGGDEKNGVHGDFSVFVKDFLKENGMTSVPIQRFRGNRFNILFTNAASVFFMSLKMNDFLKGCSSNRLLKSIHHDLQIPEFFAGCKALGLIFYLITVPLWCIIENRSIHILDSGKYYAEILQYIQEALENMEDFIEGEKTLSFSEDAETTNQRPIFQSLVRSWEHDDKVITILQILLPAISQTIRTLFTDFLQGGRFQNQNDPIRDKTGSVPKHNKFSETIFGHLDRILREKPNVSMIANEAYIMFTHNKTLDWLQKKDDAEKTALLTNARKEVKKTRKKFKEREKEIHRRRMIIIQEKLRKEEELQRTRARRLEGYTDSIIKWGLWQSENRVDFHLSSLKSKTEKLEALKSQLNFRQHVLKQKLSDHPNIYRFSYSENGSSVKLNPEQLSSNVKELIRDAFSNICDEENSSDPILVGRKVKMFFRTDDGREGWTGHVISTVPGYSSWYNITSQADEAVYTYKLLEDYKSGDLEILV